MTLIPDLDPYDYYPGGPDALAVGWLDSSAPFPAGQCPDDVRQRLAELAEHPVRLMRGRHYCQFCVAPPPRLVRPDLNGYEAPDVASGNGEIWIAARDGTNFAAPVLIVHYIDVHHYLPPTRFVDAVRLGGPVPSVSE